MTREAGLRFSISLGRGPAPLLFGVGTVREGGYRCRAITIGRMIVSWGFALDPPPASAREIECGRHLWEMAEAFYDDIRRGHFSTRERREQYRQFGEYAVEFYQRESDRETGRSA